MFKALWVRDEEPDLWRDAASLQSPAYVLRHATGVTAVDHSNASSLALLDPRTRTWSEQVLAATEIDRAMLPTLGAGPDPVGTVTAAFAEASGLAPDTVVAIGCGDEMAATLGAGVFEPGEVCDVVGTAEPVCAASAEPARTRRCSSSAIRTPTPTRGCSRTPGSSPAATSAGGETSSRRRRREEEGLGDAYDELSGEAAGSAGLRRRRVPPGDAGRDGARVERRRARRLLRADARAHATT